jgi:hypothetical protein
VPTQAFRDFADHPGSSQNRYVLVESGTSDPRSSAAARSSSDPWQESRLEQADGASRCRTRPSPYEASSLWGLWEDLDPARPDDHPARWILSRYEFGCDLAGCAGDNRALAGQPQLKGVSGHVEIGGRIDVWPGVDQIAKPRRGPSQGEIVHKGDKTVEGLEVAGVTEIAVIPRRDPPPALNRLDMADDGIPEHPVLTRVEDGFVQARQCGSQGHQVVGRGMDGRGLPAPLERLSRGLTETQCRAAATGNAQSRSG